MRFVTNVTWFLVYSTLVPVFTENVNWNFASFADLILFFLPILNLEWIGDQKKERTHAHTQILQAAFDIFNKLEAKWKVLLSILNLKSMSWHEMVGTWPNRNTIVCMIDGKRWTEVLSFFSLLFIYCSLVWWSSSFSWQWRLLSVQIMH